MSIAAGTRLGPYEILASIGAGGMGEVYRARDTTLKRDVAIKVLPEAFARDPERMARFQREAEVLASLNHPNIAAIYGVAESNNARALAMELVDGPSPKGPLPLDEAWKIASQIADALEYAHDKGIIHRDLKPANVKVTPEGVVKLLDFGLAKAFTNQREAPAAAGENSPTLTMGATEVGVILGTAAYMSPEQARGKQVDRRADIWSFGVVLYELLTGERLFRSEDAAETLAAVIHKQPDFAKVPREARRLLEECLRKDPKQRLRDIGDAKRLVESGAGSQPAAASQAATPMPIAWMAAAALLAVALAGASWIAYRARRPPELKPLVRLDVDLGSDVSPSAGPGAILSPDGSRLVFVSQGKLFTRKMDQPRATELPETQGATSPFFSPDGQWVAFFSEANSEKFRWRAARPLPCAMRPPPSLAVAGARMATSLWHSPREVLCRESQPRGGAPTPVTELDRTRGEASHRWPQVLPGGKAILFMVHTGTGAFDGANIDVMTLIDRHRKTLVRGGLYARYLPSGHLLNVSRGTLFAVPFDLDRLELCGAPVPMLEQVAYAAPFGNAQFDFSRNGTVVYRGGEGAGLVTVQWLDGAGKMQPLLARPGFYGNPKLSPDGRRLAISVNEGSNDNIWVYELQCDTMTRLTFEPVIVGNPFWPFWTPDGRYVVFAGQARGKRHVLDSRGQGRKSPAFDENQC